MTSAQLIALHRNDNNPRLPTLFVPDAPTAKITKFSARGIALLGVLVTVLVTPHLKAETSVNYPAGLGPTGIAFDGVNIWVANLGDNTVTKLLASKWRHGGHLPCGH